MQAEPCRVILNYAEEPNFKSTRKLTYLIL